MRSPHIALLLIGAALLATPAPALSKPPSKARSCGELSGKEVLGRHGSVRLVERLRRGDELYGPVAVQYACVAERRPRVLTEAQGVIRSTVAVTARHAAFAYDDIDSACTKYMGSGDPACRVRGVLVFDVRSGRAVVNRADVTARSLTLAADAVTYVTDGGETVTVPFG
ncbi:MAG TPA: hypothetical protein VIL49_03910 [Capillimicrobium sp.]|jgi:hypothetical protein